MPFNFQLSKSETIPLTRELAEEFKAMKPSPTERELNKGRMQELRSKAEDGYLVAFNWAKASLNGDLYRVNGQHSSEMLCELDGKFPKDGIVHMDTYDVQDEFGLVGLFRQFDSRKSARSAADVSGAYQGLHPNLAGVPRAVAKLAVESVAGYMNRIEGVGMARGDNRYDYFNQTTYHPFILWCGEVFSIKTPEMKSEGVGMAMWGTFAANETAAKEFWNSVARGGVEYEDEAPATVLDAWLKAAKLKDKSPPLAEYYQASIYCWNAFREGHTIATPAKVRSSAKKGYLDIVE